ncbi:SMC-Scp complex subunit ScpB [Senegalimassilia anaerobia]
MFEGLDQAQLPGAIEAMLFVTDEPVGVIELADMLEADPKLVEQALVDLREKLEREQRGIQLREVAGGWRLYTHPAYHDLVEKYVLSWDTRKLSQAAMETLAIVAYLQPCTRAGVASVRGVNSDSSINSLVEKGLIREAGQADAPGNPTLYATTRGFLEKFGLRSVSDLPDLDDFAPDDATRQLIRERLSAGGQEARVAPEAQVSDGEGADPLDGLQFDFEDEGAGAALTSQQGSGGAGVGGEARARRQVAPEHVAADGQLTFSADNPTPDASGSQAAFPSGDGPASSAAQQMLADAMAQSFGLVEKIDFDNLRFETDDE